LSPFVSVSCGTDDDVGGSTGSPCWEEAKDDAVDVDAVGGGEVVELPSLSLTGSADGGGEVVVSTAMAMAMAIGTLRFLDLGDRF
jgi:hypothetical protein